MSRRYRFRNGKACYKTREAPFVERITEISESACVYLLLKYICKYHDHYLGMHQKEGFRYSIHMPEDEFMLRVNNVFPEIELDKAHTRYVYKTNKQTKATEIAQIQITLKLKDGIFTPEYVAEKEVLFKLAELI